MLDVNHCWLVGKHEHCGCCLLEGFDHLYIFLACDFRQICVSSGTISGRSLNNGPTGCKHALGGAAKMLQCQNDWQRVVKEVGQKAGKTGRKIPQTALPLWFRARTGVSAWGLDMFTKTDTPTHRHSHAHKLSFSQLQPGYYLWLRHGCS